MAQLAVGGPTGLLGVGRNGGLFALPLVGDGARRLGDDVDAGAPVAAAHGRVAARRRDGALWVLEDGKAAVSVERNLAPAAGLLVLPAGIIGVVTHSGQPHAARLERTSAGSWHIVARSAMPVLPDARPIQADLEGSGDGGHVVLLAGPDAERYRHGVLGDAIEATRLVLLERHDLQLQRELVLNAPEVFEDIAPRRVPAPGLGAGAVRDALLLVQAGPQGGRLVLVEADKTRPGALRVAARGAAIGTVNRWMSPITGGPRWLAVHTPHIGGVLHEYVPRSDELVARRIRSDVSNHRIGSRWLDLSVWLGPRLLVPDQGGRRLLLLDAASDFRTLLEQTLPSQVAAVVAQPARGVAAALLDDGSVWAGAVPQ